MKCIFCEEPADIEVQCVPLTAVGEAMCAKIKKHAVCIPCATLGGMAVAESIENAEDVVERATHPE